MSKNSERLNIYLDKETLDEIVEQARKEERTKSKMATLLIRRALDEQRQKEADDA